jgi:hypothetical protein
MLQLEIKKKPHKAHRRQIPLAQRIDGARETPPQTVRARRGILFPNPATG